jgi:hypothetical protein
MSDVLANKAPALRSAIDRLICVIGPDRLRVGDEPGDEPERVTVVSRDDPSRSVVISVTNMREGRYSITYDELRKKHGGDASIVQTTANGVLFEGMAWITRKVLEDGVVTGEFERPPKQRRRLRE